MDAYVTYLEKLPRESHELPKISHCSKVDEERLRYSHSRTAVKSRGFSLLAPQRRQESVWRGPGVVIAVKSDTICELRTRRDVLILHHHKLKICQARNRQSGNATIRSVHVSSQNPQVRNRNRCHLRKTTNVAKGPLYRRPIYRLMPCS